MPLLWSSTVRNSVLVAMPRPRTAVNWKATVLSPWERLCVARASKNAFPRAVRRLASRSDQLSDRGV